MDVSTSYTVMWSQGIGRNYRICANAGHLYRHLWKLPIPEFDGANALHIEVSEAGEAAAKGAAEQLAALRQERERVTVTIARRELRAWLRASPEGAAVEAAVVRLLGG